MDRDFSNFELGDNVYELADGLIPEIAVHLGIRLGDEPNSDDMFKLVGKLGKNKVLRDNEEVTAINLATAANLLARSGVQEPLDRSLWTSDLQPVDSESGYSGMTIITGAVANWQDRTAKLVADGIKNGTLPRRTQIVAGNRVMDSKSDRTNPNIEEFYNAKGRYPTETEYAGTFVLPHITEADGIISLTSYDTKDGDRIASNFVRDTKISYQDGAPIIFARVANAGIQLATQFRGSIREYADPEFDSDPKNPEVFIRTDSFSVARTPEQVQDPVHYQSPYTGLRQAVLTAKMLHEATA